jgi:hypothetical protein
MPEPVLPTSAAGRNDGRGTNRSAHRSVGSPSSPTAAAVRPCLHIGLPKTASTMLQIHLFARHSQVEYLGYFHRAGKSKRRYGKCRDANVQRLMSELLSKGKKQPDFTLGRALYERAVVPGLEAGRVPVWSWESLSLNSIGTRRRWAENLHGVFGDCHVLIALRHPWSLVEAVYFQMLKRENTGVGVRWGVGVKWPPFDQWLEDAFAGPAAAPRSHLDYAKTIRTYADVFGSSSIRIVVFEQLAEDPDRFVDDVCRAVGIDAQEGRALTSQRRVNVRWTTRQMERLRHYDRSFLASLRFRFASKRERKWMLGVADDSPPCDAPRARADIPEPFKQRIAEMTRKGNRYIADTWGLPLDRYDYPL